MSQLPESDLPLPLIVAQRWNFTLAYAEIDGQFFYAVQDWLRGITDTKRPQKLWAELFSRVQSLEISLVRYPYLATNGKKYRVHYANQDTLIQITHTLTAFRYATWETLLEHDEQSQGGYLYIIGLEKVAGYYKIGVAVNPEKRLGSIRTDNPFEPYCYYAARFENYRDVESDLHKMLKAKNVMGEWFLLSDEELEAIKAYLADISA